MTGEPDRDDGDGESPSVKELLERGGDLQGERDPFVSGINEVLPGGMGMSAWMGKMLGWGLFGLAIVAVLLGAPFAADVSQGPADVERVYENVTSIEEGELPGGHQSVEGNVTDAEVGDNGSVVMRVENAHGETYAVELVGARVPGATNSEVDPGRYGLAVTGENRSCVVAAGEEARSTLAEAEGQSVRVLVNSSSVDGEGDRDVRGYVVVGERTVGLELVGHGVAVNDGEHAFDEEYADVGSLARNESVGVWSCPGYESLDDSEE